MRRIRVLLADPLTVFRSGVSNLLTRQGCFSVYEAANLDEALRGARALSPEIALVDLELPPLGGAAAIQRLAERCPARLIVWSFDPEPENVLAVMKAGASGYLHKEISPAGLVSALRGVMRGQAALSRDIATLMIDAIHGSEERDRARDQAQALSAREREVLAFLAARARNKEIATALQISEFTVKRHVQNILQKLELRSRRAAADFYRVAFSEEAAGAELRRAA